MTSEEWTLRMQTVEGKKRYFLMHECSPRNYSSTVPLRDPNEGTVVGRICFACGKEAPAYKSLLVDLSK